MRVIGLSLLAWIVVSACTARPRHPGFNTIAVLAWLTAAGLATLTALSPRLSLLGEIDQREGLLTVLAVAGIALATARSHRDERDVRLTLRVAALCGVVAALYAQLQLAGLDPVAWSGTHTYTANGTVALRPAGPLGNPNLLGIVLAVMLPLVLARLAEATSDAAWLVPAGALLAASLVMTLSRGAWLAAVLGAGVALLLALRAGARAPRVGWTLAASLSPAIGFGLARAYAPIVARLSEGSGGHSLEARGSIARGALQLWGAHPWLGVGPDAFGLAFPRVQEPALWRDEWLGLPVHAHSVPLQVLATMGVLGVLAGTAWLVAVGFGLVRAWRESPGSRAVVAALAGAFAALLAAGGVNVLGPAGAVLFAVCGALALPLCAHAAADERRAPSRFGALPALAAAIVCALTLTAAASELTALALASPARDTQRPVGSTPSEWRALASARGRASRRAVALWPHDDMLWRLACASSLAEATALTGTDDSLAIATEREAEDCARRAVALEPARAQGYASLGDALAARALRSGGAPLADSAAAAYERAAQLAPAEGWLLVAHARFQLARRDGVRALAIAQRITGLYPEAAVGHTLAGAALLLLQRTDEARAELVRARSARWEEDAGEQRAAVERLLSSVGPSRAVAHRDPHVHHRHASPRR